MAGHGPDPIDVRVGLRVRDLRVRRGLNQSQLGRALGLTFQQVQKYEKGTNRISCSKLVRIAETLSVPAAYFFEGLESDEVGSPGLMPRLPARMQRVLPDIPAPAMALLADLAVMLASPSKEAE